MRAIVILLFTWSLGPLVAAPAKEYRIMAVGDSITEGGGTFSNWRYPLFEKLYTAGYFVEFVGTRSSPSRIGELAHEGYGGKTSTYLAATVPGNFKKHPADIVLLHAGHNQSSDQKPVPVILKDIEGLIGSFRAINPKVVVLLAQPIPSGKLPKYAYIPELQDELLKLGKRLDRPDSRVVIVPQGKDFDPVKDTGADQVHPNASGAQKMAQRWFDALTGVLEKPAQAYQPEIITYKKAAKGDLTLHVFKPAGTAATPRPVIVFFFGGGWARGTPMQFYPECTHFAAKGMVAISVDYRTSFSHGTTPFDAVADAKSAIRYVRAHARELGIDPEKIVAAGASAGGQLAAATAMLSGLDDAVDDLTVSPRPNALALWYPVLDNGPDGFGDPNVKARFKEFSPLHNISASTPPCIFFLGTRDAHLSVATAKEFQAKLLQQKVRCDLHTLPDGIHPLYSWRVPNPPLRNQILSQIDAFLQGEKMQW